jgi:HSP20 family protein
MTEPTGVRAIVCVAREVDELLERFFAADELPPLWSPAMDLFVSDQAAHVNLELPGVPDSELEVRIGPRMVVVRGTKPVPVSLKQGVSFHESEIPYGPFEKRIALPVAVRPERHRVALSRGVLEIEVERAGLQVRVVKVD